MKRIKIKPDDERTIPEVLEEFTLLKESENIAPKTIHNYVQSIGKFQNETGVELITELTDMGILAFVAFSINLIICVKKSFQMALNTKMKNTMKKTVA